MYTITTSAVHDDHSSFHSRFQHHPSPTPLSTSVSRPARTNLPSDHPPSHASRDSISTFPERVRVDRSGRKVWARTQWPGDHERRRGGVRLQEAYRCEHGIGVAGVVGIAGSVAGAVGIAGSVAVTGIAAVVEEKQDDWGLGWRSHVH